MSGLEDEANLAAYVADETAWGQFAEAHTTERLQILSDIGRYGCEVSAKGGGGYKMRSLIGDHDLGEYDTIEDARAALRPGGKWSVGGPG